MGGGGGGKWGRGGWKGWKGWKVTGGSETEAGGGTRARRTGGSADGAAEFTRREGQSGNCYIRRAHKRGLVAAEGRGGGGGDLSKDPPRPPPSLPVT